MRGLFAYPLALFSRGCSLTICTIALALLPACADTPAQVTDGGTGTSTGASAATSTGPFDPTTTGFELLCQPGSERCADGNMREVCKPSGLAWELVACNKHQVCSEDGDGSDSTTCIGPCEVASATPSSVGCEFLAMRVRSFNGADDPAIFYDALIVGNPDKVEAAELQLYFAANGAGMDEPIGDPVTLAPGESHIFEMTTDAIGGYSAVRSGGVYRVVSDIPVIAYLHSPFKNGASNDSSMLLPTRSLRQDYVIASYPAFADKTLPDDKNGRPSYFNVIALENDTTIEWTPRSTTFGNGFPFVNVAPGETGSITINRGDVMQVGAASPDNDIDFSKHDVSGTVLHADKPIWVLGGTACAFVPFGSTGACNHLQEQMLPIEYWGTRYVGAHSPLRADEPHIWRIYAGEAGVSVTTEPSQPGTPFTLSERGAFKEIVVASGKSFTFQGTGPFLPVQYLVGKNDAGNKGDPAMYQMIPIEQFLGRYVFVTGVGYDTNYAQVIRVAGAADVTINGEVVTGYYLVNGLNKLKYEVADWPLAPGVEPKVYLAESDDPFGVMVIGYNSSNDPGFSAYAYPGGMALKRLVPL